jgi:Lon protease-like protein
MGARVLPMFPLGSVLFPSMVLPLHVFEPRYRQLVHDCIEGEPEFGVVLIERGSEVGGGDQRSSVGTIARIVEAAPFDDGRWAIGCVGVQRVRVARWLSDDPYPKAEVEEWNDGDIDTPPDADRLGATVQAVRQALALHSELGDAAAPATIELSDDPVLASYQLAAVGPFGPADRQELLEAPDASARLERLHALTIEDLDYLRLRLDMDSGDDPEP